MMDNSPILEERASDRYSVSSELVKNTTSDSFAIGDFGYPVIPIIFTPFFLATFKILIVSIVEPVCEMMIATSLFVSCEADIN